MKKTQNKGFTLVELIIVITILAILATIAFVSFSGYAGQSRDAKKQAELLNLKNKVDVAIAANSQDVMSFVGTDSSAVKLTSGANFAWATVNTSTWYNAWEFNYASVGADASKYTFDYAIWAVKNNWGSFYQLATKLEDESVYTIGNYSPRIGSGSLTYDVTWTVSWTKFTVSWSEIWKLRVGDTINASVKVNKVSSDLSTYELSATITAPATLSNEDKYLINTTNLNK